MVLLLTLARAACGRDRGSMGANEAKDAAATQRFQNRPPGRQGEGVRASNDGEPTASGPRQPTDGLHDLGSQTSLETAARVGREFRRSIDPVHEASPSSSARVLCCTDRIGRVQKRVRQESCLGLPWLIPTSSARPISCNQQRPRGSVPERLGDPSRRAAAPQRFRRSCFRSSMRWPRGGLMVDLDSAQFAELPPEGFLTL